MTTVHEWWKWTGAAQVTVVCIPWAGAGAAPFSSWADRFPADVDLCALRLPGREARFAEEPVADLGRLVTLLADEVEALELPAFALFGHCFGGLVAFELAREFVRRGRARPTRLLVASQPAPRLSGVSEAEQAEDMWDRVRRAGQIPPAVIESAEMRAVLGPAIAADLAISDRYAYESGPALDLPIVVIGGSEDGTLTSARLAAWEQETTGPFAFRLFEADHFFRDGGWPVLADAVAAAATADPAVLAASS